ncbi:MAG: Flp family type IVb pilin [Clostridia bacterium]|nr:Flp family type IVb pilin [Clostridia bacterium]
MEGKTMLTNWLKDEDGQGMVEYGLIIALIAIVVIAALVLLGPKIKEIFDKTNDALDTAEPAG